MQDKFFRRWLEHDKSRMLKLLNIYGAATYDYYTHKRNMQFQRDLTHENINLVGKVYDIVFVSGHYSDLSSSRTISRSVKNGTLNFFTKQIESEDDLYAPGTDVMYGRIEIEKGSFSPDYNSRAHAWESLLQTNNIEFRQRPASFFGEELHNNSLTFSIINCENWGENWGLDDEYEINFKVITNNGTIDWIPTEYDAVDNPIDGYKSFMQNKILCHNNGQDDWCPESSWLCNHMNLPQEAAHKIHSFLLHSLPDPHWAWQKDDMLIGFIMRDQIYTSMWTTEYIARPRRVENCVRRT